MEKLHFPALMNRCSVQTGFSKTSSQFGRVMTAGFSAFFFSFATLCGSRLAAHRWKFEGPWIQLLGYWIWTRQFPVLVTKEHMKKCSYFHAWAKSILQSPVPILAHRYVNTTRSGCCTTMIPCVPKWSHQPSPQMHVSVAFSPLQKKKKLLVLI